jgi:hypothetical protein
MAVEKVQTYRYVKDPELKQFEAEKQNHIMPAGLRIMSVYMFRSLLLGSEGLFSPKRFPGPKKPDDYLEFAGCVTGVEATRNGHTVSIAGALPTTAGIGLHSVLFNSEDFMARDPGPEYMEAIMMPRGGISVGYVLDCPPTIDNDVVQALTDGTNLALQAHIQ